MKNVNTLCFCFIAIANSKNSISRNETKMLHNERNAVIIEMMFTNYNDQLLFIEHLKTKSRSTNTGMLLI